MQSLSGVNLISREIQFDQSNMSAFGTLETGELTPVFQADFVYGLNTQVWDTAVASGTGASVDANSGRLRVQSGTASNGYAYLSSRKPLKYRAGQGVTVRYTDVFSSGIANNIQLCGVGNMSGTDPYDGYFFGYNGTSFGVVHYNRGTPNWTAQGDWNGDKADGSAGSAWTYNTQYGSPMMIKYPYLGYGNITFWIQNPDTSRWTLVHSIKYVNTSDQTQLGNPSLKFLVWTKNSGNTTNKTIYAGSVGAFLSGHRHYVGNPKWASDNNKSSITTETNLLTIKNCTTYNGATNRALIRPLSLFASSSGANGIATIRFKLKSSLGGSPSYAAISGSTADGGETITSGNSIASVDKAGTTVTGGTYMFAVALDNPSSSGYIDLEQYECFIAPTDTLTVSAESSASSQINITLNWSEDI